MNAFCFEHLLITFSCIALAIFIAYHAKDTSHRLWAYTNCAVAGWSFFSFLAGISKTPDQATLYWRFSYASGMFIAVFFYHFVCCYFKLNRKIFLIIIYTQAVVLFLLYIFCNFVRTKYLFNSIYYITSSPFVNLSLSCWWIITLTAFYEFFMRIKSDPSLKKSSVIMFYAWLIGFSGGTTTFLPSYGIMLYPAWHISVCLYVGIMTYAIFYDHINGLAHEIRNPLSTLRTFVEYLPQRKNDPEFMQRFQEIVPQELERINNLICELSSFTKHQIPHMQNINPNIIIQNLLIMSEQNLKSANIRVITDLDSATIKVDPNQFKQALLNLIINAIDAMPHGGTLTINTSVIASPSSDVIASAEGAKQSLPSVIPAQAGIFTIKITDTGLGIDPKDLPHVFEPSFTTKKDKGTGFGLTITQKIIEKHGGTINVQSELDRGTTFKITLKAS